MRAALLLYGIRVRLLLHPPSLVKKRLKSSSTTLALVPGSGGASSWQVVWAVAVAGRYVPGGRGCLPQALAAETLLKRYGFPAELKIGVAMSGGGIFQAHAWVESRGEILVGKAEAHDYKVLSMQGTGP